MRPSQVLAWLVSVRLGVVASLSLKPVFSLMLSAKHQRTQTGESQV